MTQIFEQPPTCDGCGSTPTKINPVNGERLCPTCARNYALGTAASSALVAIIAPQIEDWARYWHAAGVELKELKLWAEDITAQHDFNSRLETLFAELENLSA